MFQKSLPMCMAALVVALLAATVLGADPRQHEGMVVSAGNGKLVMTDTAGKQHSHDVPEAAKITVNGKPAKLSDLKPGVRVRVMTDAEGKVMSVGTVDDMKSY